jgi:hypothetical protein
MDRDFTDEKIIHEIYYSRTYVRIRRMALVLLCGMSNSSNIMSDYLDRVWFRDMMKLMTLIVIMVLMI